MKIKNISPKIQTTIANVAQKAILRTRIKNKFFYLNYRTKTFKTNNILIKKKKEILGMTYTLNIRSLRHHRYKQMCINYIIRQNPTPKKSLTTKLLALKKLATSQTHIKKGIRTRFVTPTKRGFLGLTSNGIIGLIAKHELKNLIKLYYSNLKRSSKLYILPIFYKKKVHTNKLQLAIFTSLKKLAVLAPKWHFTHNYYCIKEFLLFKLNFNMAI